MILLDRRYRWTPSAGPQATCRVRAFQSPLGPLVIVTAVPKPEALVRLEGESNSLVLALAASVDFLNLPGFTGLDSAMWFIGRDAADGPYLQRIQQRMNDRWEVDPGDHLDAKAFECFMDGAKLEDLLEERIQHDT